MKCLYEEETDMRYTLENENLKVEIDSFGAEIKSVKRKSESSAYSSGNALSDYIMGGR